MLSLEIPGFELIFDKRGGVIHRLVFFFRGDREAEIALCQGSDIAGEADVADTVDIEVMDLHKDAPILLVVGVFACPLEVAAVLVEDAAAVLIEPETVVVVSEEEIAGFSRELSSIPVAVEKSLLREKSANFLAASDAEHQTEDGNREDKFSHIWKAWRR